MAPPTTKKSVSDRARFVFEGVVKQALRAAGKKKAGEDSFVVHVDSVVRAPDALADCAGSEVTVYPAPGEKLQAGDRLLFYTDPATWGATVGVRSLGHAAPAAAPGGRRMAAARAAKPLADQRLEEQVSAADLVLSGTVSAVRLPEEAAPAATGMRAAMRGAGEAAKPQRISEHDPLWREAVIDVQDVHKGEASKQVVIRFPSSTDVRWHKAPKFRPGQQGVWLLQKKDIARPAGAVSAKRAAGGPLRAAEAAPAPEYTALHPDDFQPLDRVEGIKTLIQASQREK